MYVFIKFANLQVLLQPLYVSQSLATFPFQFRTVGDNARARQYTFHN